MTTQSSPRPPPSALTTLSTTTTTTNKPTPQSATTTQILHNLQHQHLWTSLKTHVLQPLDPSADSGSPAYLISGVPPHRVYTHPDEQLYLLEKGLREDDIPAERMFVIPTAQGQAWSLRRMAAVFDSVTETEGDEDGEGDDGEKVEALKAYYAQRKKARETREWGGKRMLLAMVDKGMGGDGTVVYYVVQEGAVKPRQN